MPLLDAALAFALTMLVVAAAATQIVEVFRAVARLRSRHLKKMLDAYFTEELKPAVEGELKRLNRKVSTEVASKLTETAESFSVALDYKEKELAKLTEVKTEELVARLKRSELGQKLFWELGDRAQVVFDELGRRYEHIGDQFTKSFRKHSRWWATGVTFVLALVINIDSIFIADSYIKNQTMREGVIAQMDALTEKNGALAESIEQAHAVDEKIEKKVIQTANETRKQLEALTSMGFPIGWAYFPHSRIANGKSPDYDLWAKRSGWLMWVLGICLTAGLGGLGAPFWYDAVTGISTVIQRTRAGKSPTPQRESEESEGAKTEGRK